MSSRDSSSDYESVSQGPSERYEPWGQGRRRHKYKAWPPTNAPSYPVWKRSRIYRNVVVETMGESSSDVESDRVTTSNDGGVLKARWQEVAERKVDVYAIRCRIKRARSQIEQARQNRDTVDNTFMSALRPTQVNSTALRAILPENNFQTQFQRMQAARDKYQQCEMDMIKLEQSLTQTQDELDLLERRLINHLRHPTRDNTARKSMKIPVPEQPQSELLRGLEIEPANICNPLYQQLVSALHSFGLARRRRVEILARRARLQEQQRLLLIFEKYHPAALQYITPLESRDIGFLDLFEMEERKVSIDMADRRKEVERLTRLCWQRKLIPQYTSLEDVLSWYPDEFSIDLDLGHDHVLSASTEPTNFPVLLSDPSHLLADFPVTAEAALKQATSIPEGHPQRAMAIASAAKEFSIQNLISDAQDTPNLINRWLLQSLRTSRLQVGALYSSYLASGDVGIFDIETWQWEVLQTWWDDEDHMRTLEHFRPAPTSWISAPPSPPSWLSEPFLYTWDSDDSDPKFEMIEFEKYGELDETGFQA